MYRNAEPEELAGLHPADRLMVKLIQIDRLGQRIENMLYKLKFDEQYSLLDDSARKLSEAGRALLDAFFAFSIIRLACTRWRRGRATSPPTAQSQVNTITDELGLHEAATLGAFCAIPGGLGLVSCVVCHV